MNKSKRIFFLFFLLFIVVACNHSSDPSITITAQVLELSDKEFSYIGTHGLENPSKDDFRKFKFRIYMKHLDKLTSQKIHTPKGNIWKDAIGARYWFGSVGNVTDDEVGTEFFSEFIFYSKGLNEKEIKRAFDLARIDVSWVSEEGKTTNKEFTIGEFVEFIHENKES